MNSTIKILVNNKQELIYPDKIKVKDILKDINSFSSNPIIGAKINNQIIDFNYVINKDSKIEFFDKTDLNGYRMYIAGLKMVLEISLKNVFDHDTDLSFDHSIGNGIHVTLKNISNFTPNDLTKVKLEMQRIINANEPFIKLNVASKEAISYYKQINYPEKALNIRNITNPLIILYKLEKYINYYYAEMPYSTICLNDFELIYINNYEIALMFGKKDTDFMAMYQKYRFIIDCFKQGKDWINKLNIPYIASINQEITKGRVLDLIRTCETAYNNELNNLVKEVIRDNKKFVMISGPSSSGKTTTSKKICLNLASYGYHPILLSTDDYFLNRIDSPKDQDGNYNFECLEAIDIKALNKDLNDLLMGKEVSLPTFNFIKGIKEYSNKVVKMDNNSIVVIEGLHCLNDELTPELRADLKYKVYLSPFIPVNVDSHNYISTTDLRLIRRIIRDNNNRGYNVSTTIESWQNVRKGEAKYIFPYIDQANITLNSALAYELGVLKVYVDPLLFSVTIDSPYYEEARRLINFLKNVFPIPSEYVSNDSVIREFIGGSSFKEKGDK
jgi:uridine kinase